MSVVKSFAQIRKNIINYEKLRFDSRIKKVLADKLNYHATYYYLAYKVHGDEDFHFLWGKYVGYEWNGFENYNPYETNGKLTRVAVNSLLREPFQSEALYKALVKYYGTLVENRIDKNFGFKKNCRVCSFWRLKDIITV